MKNFLVYIEDDKGRNVAEKIGNDYPYPKSYKISDHMFFVKSDKLTEDLLNDLGFRSDGDTPAAIGFVTTTDTINGFYAQALWDWINNG